MIAIVHRNSVIPVKESVVILVVASTVCTLASRVFDGGSALGSRKAFAQIGLINTATHLSKLFCSIKKRNDLTILC